MLTSTHIVHFGLMLYSKAFIVARLSMTAVIGDCDVCHHLTNQQEHQPALGAPAGAGWDGKMATACLHLLNTAWADLVVGSPCKLEQASSFLELVFPQNLFISSRSTSELALMWSYLLSQQQDEKATSIVSTQHIQRGIWPTSQHDNTSW